MRPKCTVQAAPRIICLSRAGAYPMCNHLACRICLMVPADPRASCSLDVPQFLMSTKFFACLELEDSRKVAEAATTVHIPPHRILFEAGDGGAAGIYVVVEGSVGMFLSDGDQLIQTNSLQPGESVGDLDILDGEILRTPGCCPSRRACQMRMHASVSITCVEPKQSPAGS